MSINLNTNVTSFKARSNNLAFQKNKMIYVCSPLATGGEEEMKQKDIDIKTHIKNNMNNALHYAKKVWDNGDFPLWYHSTLPHFVDDTVPADRKRAMQGCLELVKRSDALCYFDKPKGGMVDEILLAHELGIPVITPDMLPQVDEIVENTKK